jgi:isoleucyl-tRNA synthetase
VEISSEDIPGWLVASEGRLTVALDVTITEELKQEGIARELVNRIQNLRKDSNLEVQDKIHIIMQASIPEVNAAVDNFRDYIQTETQAISLELTDNVVEGTLLEVDDYQVNIHIRTEAVIA